jgi:DNA-binding transcriptional LysR family regulator
MLRRACEHAGFTPHIAFESDDYAAIQGFVAAGVGVALIAELALTTVRDDIVIRSLGRETPLRRIHAAVLAGGYRSPATVAMLEILTDVAGRYRPRRPELALAG